MNKFSMICRSLQTTARLFEWKPSTYKGVVGLYEFFQGGIEKPNPIPTVKEMTTGLILFYFILFYFILFYFCDNFDSKV